MGSLTNLLYEVLMRLTEDVIKHLSSSTMPHGRESEKKKKPRQDKMSTFLYNPLLILPGLLH